VPSSAAPAARSARSAPVAAGILRRASVPVSENPTGDEHGPRSPWRDQAVATACGRAAGGRCPALIPLRCLRLARQRGLCVGSGAARTAAGCRAGPFSVARVGRPG